MTLTIYDGKHFLWVIERLVVVLLVQMWYIKPIGYLCTVNIFAKAFLGYNCQKVLAPLAFFTAHHSMGIRYPWNTQFMGNWKIGGSTTCSNVIHKAFWLPLYCEHFCKSVSWIQLSESVGAIGFLHRTSFNGDKIPLEYTIHGTRWTRPFVGRR